MRPSVATSERDVVAVSTQSAYHVEVAPTSWMLPDRVGFPRWIRSQFRYPAHTSDPALGHDDDARLFPQQRFVRDFLQPSSPYRGLLLFHGLGSGKSLSGLAATEVLLQPARERTGTDNGTGNVTGRRRRSGFVKSVVIMVPAFLHTNYVGEIKKFGAPRFRERGAWEFSPSSKDRDKTKSKDKTTTTTPPRAPGPGPDPAVVRRHGGIWLPIGRIDYMHLTPSQRAEVSAQIDSEVERTYRFVHYNGLNVASVERLCGGVDNIFDDSVVVIDEAATFVQQVKNANKGLVRRVYQRLLDANRCKIIMLSGTPMTNEPVELAYYVNLARGYIPSIDIVLPLSTADGGAAVGRLLDAHPRVESHTIDTRTEGGVRRHVATIMPYPEGFGRASGQGRGMVSRLASPTNEETTIGDLVSRLRDLLGLSASERGAVIRRRLVLPLDPVVFADAFLTPGVEHDDGSRGEPVLRNGDVLMRRMMGTISVFDSNFSIMPTVRTTRLVRIPLSERQFDEYVLIRDDERRKERMARMYAIKGGDAGDGGSGGAGVYRTLSILVLLFVFPIGIVRPWPKDVRAALADEHDAEGDGDPRSERDGGTRNRGVGRAQRAYEDARTLAMERVREARDALSGRPVLELGGGLEELSPKFAHLIRHLTAPDATVGPVIVYSQFRNAEGINLLTMALDANGFDELRVSRGGGDGEGDGDGVGDDEGGYVVRVMSRKAPRSRGPDLKAGRPVVRPRYIVYDNTDAKATDIALRIFRDDLDTLPPSVTRSLRTLGTRDVPRGTVGNRYGGIARLLLITQSGSEGISTRNVREVHVLEPFWHNSRIQQVIGRAVRANSHADLPMAERMVDVFIYVAEFTQPQRERHNISRLDRGMTSDEHVFSVALRKLRVIKQFVGLMRRVAVDCSMHRAKTGACYDAMSVSAGDDTMSMAYSTVSLDADIKRARLSKKAPLRSSGLSGAS